VLAHRSLARMREPRKWRGIARGERARRDGNTHVMLHTQLHTCENTSRPVWSPAWRGGGGGQAGKREGKMEKLLINIDVISYRESARLRTRLLPRPPSPRPPVLPSSPLSSPAPAAPSTFISCIMAARRQLHRPKLWHLR